jgi:hypothetical protein
MHDSVKDAIVRNATATIDAAHNQMLNDPRSMDTRYLLVVLQSVKYDIDHGATDLTPVYNAGLLEYYKRRQRSAARSKKLLAR